ncbi:MAG: AAA family ATPase [Kiritimatiellia bacterium]|nr:AAA family ATPase [Kiritimatiellia bacterium]
MNSILHSYIDRAILSELLTSLEDASVTGLLGPRQCGKSTLALHLLSKWRGESIYLDLERPSHLRKMRDPELFLSQQRGKLVCLDEVQRLPTLFPVLRALVDDASLSLRFLLLGSAAPDLIRQSSESLAGRIRYSHLTPFQWREVRQVKTGDSPAFFMHWRRGGFPGSFLASSESASLAWRESFARTFLERDILMHGGMAYSETLARLWRMAAHGHGQLLNSSRLGESLGISHTTVRNYLGLLERTYMLRLLPPLHANLKKRLVKAPKLYFRDSGILHGLLELEDQTDLFGHPSVGSSWEGWCIEQIVAALPRWRASFYRDSNGQEVDLILERRNRRLAFECKASLSPELTRSGRAALEILQPERAFVVCPMAEEGYDIAPNLRICGPDELLRILSEIESVRE